MAALTRPDTANYEIHEHVRVDTTGTCGVRAGRRKGRFFRGVFPVLCDDSIFCYIFY
jgi:hypothetical protein